MVTAVANLVAGSVTNREGGGCMAGYPANWDSIALAVKVRADWRCEHCGHEHDLESGHVLTVHHLDGDPSNCVHKNLVALCQRCHLHIQARYRPGQLVLPGVERPYWMIERGLGDVEHDEQT